MFEDNFKLNDREEPRPVSQDGRRHFPLGFCLFVLASVSLYLLIRIDIGLPVLIAPIQESAVVETVLEIMFVVSALACIAYVWSLIIRQEPIESSRWELRFVGKTERFLNCVLALPLMIILFEMFFGLLSLVGLLFGLAA